MYLINKKYFIYIFFNIMIYFILSLIFSRSVFSSETDGFYYQIMSVANSNELGSLSIIHNLRYIVIYPFYLVYNYNLPIVFQHFLLLLYVSPLFFLKIPRHISYLGVLILYMSIFFSYRTILVMESVFILIILIKYNLYKKKYLFISLIYSFLSSGTFLVYLFFIYMYRKKFISNRRFLKYIYLFIILLMVVLIGPLMHKVLFFIDPITYGSATSVSIDKLLNISSENLITMFMNIFERSFIYESYSSMQYFRLIIIFIMFIMLSILLFVQKTKLIFLMSIFYIFGLFFEGLIMYSLFFVTLVLFLDYLYRNFKSWIISCQKKY